MKKGEIWYEGYGVDEHGRTGVIRTPNKQEIINYAKKAKNATVVYVIEIKEEIPINEVVEQLSMF